MKRILFVCHGNICRSPMAQGIFARAVCDLDIDIDIDSAGVSGWHRDEAPDMRAQAVCAKRGIDISKQRSRPVCKEDFSQFDYILAMDRSNLETLKALYPHDEGDALAKIELFLDYAQDLAIEEIPDPYYSKSGFEKVFTLIEAASAGLINALER